MRYALLNDLNEVLNLTKWDGITPCVPPAGTRLILVPDNVILKIGWTWDGINDPQPPAEVAE